MCYVCIYVCMYVLVCMYVCVMYVCMCYVCLYVSFIPLRPGGEKLYALFKLVPGQNMTPDI